MEKNLGERRLLLCLDEFEALADSPDNALDGAALQALEPDRQRLNQTLRTLLRREIILRRADGYFQIAVPLVSDYVRSQRLV